MTFFAKSKPLEASYIELMQRKIDSLMGRHIYSQRLGTVEPVFGHLEANKGLKRGRTRQRPVAAVLYRAQ